MGSSPSFSAVMPAATDGFSPFRCSLPQRYPAKSWKDAFPLGNGALGALVHGRIAAEVITLNHERLWGGGVRPELPDISATLPHLRKLLDAGRYGEAEPLYRDALKAAGYENAKVAAFMPGPDLQISARSDAGFTDYGRELDLLTGEAHTRWKEGGIAYARRMFISAEENLFVASCGVEPGAKRLFTLSLAPHDLRDSLTQHLSHVGLVPEIKRFTFPHGAGIEVDLGNGCRYAAVFLVCHANRLREEGAGAQSFEFGPQTYLLATLAPLDGEGATNCAELYSRLEQVREDDHALFARHLKAHHALLGAVEFDLGCSADERAVSNEELLLEAYSGSLPSVLVERMFHLGRYLLATSSRPNGLPAHLQGVWNGDYAPPWRSAFFNNENLQMTYWQALAGGLSETLLPVFDLYERRMGDFRTNARHLFGCRGMVLPLYMSPECGLQKDLQSHVIYWTGAGGWLSQLFWEYWLFTKDERFLAERAVPFMREAALFYEDFSVKGAGGEILIYPGNSPENKALPHRTAVCINATMDFALMRELLGNLQAAYAELGWTGEGELERWQELREALPPYEVDTEGAFREWLHADFGENHEHRHISHIYPFFPGHEIAPDLGDPRFAAVRKAVEKRMTIGLGDQTGWSLVHLANIFGRLQEGEKAWDCLRFLAQSCTGASLFTYHNDTRGMGMTMDMRYGVGAPLQLDANFGYSAAVIEMLLYSSPNEVRPLPALPQAWRRGKVSGLQTRCGVEIALEWDLESEGMTCELRALRDVRFALRLPETGLTSGLSLEGCGERAIEITLRKGETERFEFRAAEAAPNRGW